MPSTPHAQEFGVLETTSRRGVARAKSCPTWSLLVLRSLGARMNAAVLTGPSLAELTNEAE